MELSELDRKIVNRLSGDLPDGMSPFATVARELGLGEAELLEKVTGYANTGIMRRFGAIVAHRRGGYAANALVAWVVPDDKVAGVAHVMSDQDEVSHCYERLRYRQWRYNIYTMIHGQSRDDCLKVVERIAARTGRRDYRVLFTVREFKKESVRYFDR